MNLDNSEDLIDSRDIIERIEELESIEERDEDESHELAMLSRLWDEVSGCAPDWEYGATLIRESYFVEYVQDMLEHCGDIPKDLPHYIHIDWERTARDIRIDYTKVDFDGITYLVR